MAAAKAKGGPTVYTKATTPDWDGYYARDQRADHGAEWIWGTVNQVPTILSLLTPEYQKRMVQMNYHEAVDNAPQWEASFCYPEGFMRWWAQASQGGNFQLTMTPWQVQFLSGIAANFLRQVLIGKEHVQKVPQWYGETVGFWDGTTLVSWTANVQAWTLSHSMFEFSDKMETVETFKPVYDASGKFMGLDHETVFYDPEAFVQPLRATYRYVRRATPDNPTQRYTYIECLSNLRNTDGRPTQLTKADPRYIDYYGRPWAQNWEKYFEVGWDKPQDTSAARYTRPFQIEQEGNHEKTTNHTWMIAGLLAFVARLYVTPASAHHSFAMYDQTKTTVLTGVAYQFVAQANHAELHFYVIGPDGKLVKDKDGKNVDWGVEMAGAAAVAAQGITADCVPRGYDLQRQAESSAGRQ